MLLWTTDCGKPSFESPEHDHPLSTEKLLYHQHRNNNPGKLALEMTDIMLTPALRLKYPHIPRILCGWHIEKNFVAHAAGCFAKEPEDEKVCSVLYIRDIWPHHRLTQGISPNCLGWRIHTKGNHGSPTGNFSYKVMPNGIVNRPSMNRVDIHWTYGWGHKNIPRRTKDRSLLNVVLLQHTTNVSKTVLLLALSTSQCKNFLSSLLPPISTTWPSTHRLKMVG